MNSIVPVARITDSLAAHFDSLHRALKANEVAQLLRVTRDTVYAYAKRGELPSFNIGATKTVLRFDSHELAQWVRSPELYRAGIALTESV
jgi:excisionase family DNA binding protein